MLTLRTVALYSFLAALIVAGLVPFTATAQAPLPPRGPLLRNVSYSYCASLLANVTGVGGLNESFIGYAYERAVGRAFLNTSPVIQVNVTRVIDELSISPQIRPYNGNVSVEVTKSNTIEVSSTIPYLIRVIVYSASHEQLAWTGMATGPVTVEGLAYVNGSAVIGLQYLNGTSIVQVNLTVPTYGRPINKDLSLRLHNITVKASINSTFTEIIVANAPRRYSPFFAKGYFEGEPFNTSAGFNVTKAYFNGTLMPALVWRAKAGISSSFMGSGFRGSIDLIDINFYGINGTLYAFVREITLNATRRSGTIGYGGMQSPGGGSMRMSWANAMASQAVIAVVNESAFSHVMYEGWATVAGQPVIIAEGPEGKAMSTAYVNVSHEVVLHGKRSLLVIITLNGTEDIEVLTPSNVTIKVQVTRPSRVTAVNVTIGHYVYKAQKIVVNLTNTSQPIIFNVTPALTGPIMVYKMVNGTLVPLNSSNYFICRGSIVIFDDPSETYYVVYNSTATPVTTTTAITTTSSTTSVATTASTVPTTTATTLTTITTTVTTTRPTTVTAYRPPSYAMIAAVAAVIVIAVIVIVIVATKR